MNPEIPPEEFDWVFWHLTRLLNQEQKIGRLLKRTKNRQAASLYRLALASIRRAVASDLTALNN